MAKAEAALLLGPARVVAAREVRNGSCSALLEMLGRSDLGRPNHAARLGDELYVAALWRLRGVSRAFRGWCGLALAAMPRVVAVGGARVVTRLTTAVSLDLATLVWGGGGAVPDLASGAMRVVLARRAAGGAASGGQRQH